MLVFTPAPTIWTRTLRSHSAVARENARQAARVLHDRRAEREEIERWLLDAGQQGSSNGAPSIGRRLGSR